MRESQAVARRGLLLWHFILDFRDFVLDLRAQHAVSPPFGPAMQMVVVVENANFPSS